MQVYLFKVEMNNYFDSQLQWNVMKVHSHFIETKLKQIKPCMSN